MNIKYQGNDKLYVPIEQIDQVQKYVGSEGKDPKVYKLGGNDWKKVKTKVEKSVQDIADDLIKLYAEREASKGYAYTPDTAEQQEFESSSRIKRQRINYVLLKRLKRIWNADVRWIGFFVVM